MVVKALGITKATFLKRRNSRLSQKGLADERQHADICGVRGE